MRVMGASMSPVDDPTSAYRIEDARPDPREYRAICEAVGWGPWMNFEVAEASLAASLFHVTVRHEGRAVGMGRIVGDGQIYFYVQDVAVVPAHQGLGLGRQILARLLAHLREHAPEKAFVGLFAAPGTEPFYERYGFAVRDALVGMFQVLPDHRG